MPKTIVIPLDQSENAERALSFAGLLAHQLAAQVRLITVYEIPPEYGHWAQEPQWEAESYLAGIAHRLRPLTVTTEVLRGKDPAIEIDAAVRDLDEPLVVMASHGQSRLRRMVLGSKAARLIQLASYPICLVPAGADALPTQVERILLPMDGSPFAEHALEVVREMFEARAPVLHLMRVIDRIQADSPFKADLRWEVTDQATEYLKAVSHALEDAGWMTAWEIVEAWDVAETIVDRARALDASLIAMATHGRTGFSRLFVGSVADAVLRSARTPVLVVRPSQEVVQLAPDRRFIETDPSECAPDASPPHPHIN